MNEPHVNDNGRQLPPAQPGHVTQLRGEIVYRFEKALQDGHEPRPEQYLQGEGVYRQSLLMELLQSDLELRLRAGGDPRVKQYLDRFPELANHPEHLLALLDAELRHRRLLGRHQFPQHYYVAEFGPLLGSRLDALFKNLPPARVELVPGTTIAGRYKIMQELGEGGMGTVFVAEQREPVKRLVALKLIKTGMNFTRFEAERQALALMDHPNIAKMLDGGVTEQHQPYFVMELVKGVPINKFCDQEHLTPKERLQLFIPVCQAVQHAHQKGIIHRDLKPNNILVGLYDGKPVAKVIDFGVAKAVHQKLTERTMYTEVGSIIGTLEYMAPEQAELNNLDIDTRADIYALGVILYELLTGSTPFSSKQLRDIAFHEMLRMIREEEPQKPSTKISSSDTLPAIAAKRKLEPKRLKALVAGELDWIVMKCLEKDRARRYETANGLASDITRFLNDEPVTARAPSRWYRFRKLVQRKKVQATAAALVLLALVAAVIGTVIGLVQAQRQQLALLDKERAIQARDTAEEARRRADEQRTLAERKTREADEQRTLAERNALEANKQRQLAESKSKELVEKGELVKQIEYDSNIVLAHKAWDDDRVQRMMSLLNTLNQSVDVQKLRGMEWHYLRRLAESGYTYLIRNHTCALRPAITRDDHYVITARHQEPGVLQLYDLTNNATLRKVNTNVNGLFDCIVMAPDKKGLVAFTTSGELYYLSDYLDGKTTTRLGKQLILNQSGPAPTTISLDFSPDGKYLAMGTKDCRVIKLDIASDQVIFERKFDGAEIWNITFDMTGNKLLFGASTDCFLIDATTGNTLITCEGKSVPSRYKAENGTCGFRAVTFTQNDTQVAAACYTGHVVVFNAQNGEFVRGITAHHIECHAIQSLQSGKLALTCSRDQTVRLWDTQNWQPRAQLRNHLGSVAFVTGSASGNWAVSVGDNHCLLWDLRLRQQTPTFEVAVNSVQSCAFSKDGKTVYLPDGKRLHHLRSHDLSVIKTVPLQNVPVGVELSTAGDELYLASLESLDICSLDGSVKWSIPLDMRDGELHKVMALRPDGKELAIRSKPNECRLLNTQTWEAQAIIPFNDGDLLSCFSYTPDGRSLLITNVKKNIVKWNTETKSIDWTVPGLPFVTCADHQGNYLAVGGWEGELNLYELSTGKFLRQFVGHTHHVTALAFSPDGKRLISGSSDHSLMIWDTSTGMELLSLREHPSAVKSITLSPDGHRIMSISPDGTCHVWDATPVLGAVTEDLAAQARQYLQVGNLKQSVDYFEKALLTARQQGPDHSQPIDVLHDLAHAYQRSQKYDLAVDRMQQAINSMNQLELDRGENITLLRCATRLYEEASRFDLAAVAGKQYIAMTKKYLGGKDTHYAQALVRQGYILTKLMKWQEAETVLLEGLTLRQVIEPDSWTTYSTMSILGMALMKQAKYQDAEPQLLKGYEGLIRRETTIPAEGLARMTEALERLVEFYSLTNRPQEVERWRRELDIHQKKHPAPKQP